MLTTTKQLLRKYDACEERYEHLVEVLGPSGDNDTIPLTRIVELNGIEDAIWALVAVPSNQQVERDRLARLFACACVRKTPLADGRFVWDLLTDERSRHAVEIAERFAKGNATAEELAAARAAAWNAARDAAWDAARDAAWAAARASARDAAAWGAARAAAAWDAARDAARAAAAWDAARDAARDAQEKIFKALLTEK